MNPTEPVSRKSVVGVIPARWGSTRFPGKPLHLIGGKSLIQRVWEQCRQCPELDRILVATDDVRIAEAVNAFGGEVAMTRDDHPSGTDRIAEVVASMDDCSAVINIQGDEPLISPGLIGELAQVLTDDETCRMVTAANPMAPDDPELEDPNVVKVTIDRRGYALYFSRSLVPHPRNRDIPGARFLRHKGIYGYRRDFLLQFVAWEPSVLEQIEGLEQLRALENGTPIRVILTDDDSPGIDTPEQAWILDKRIST